MSYCHLNARERTGIFYLRQQGLSIRHIGRRLKRSHTTISRELRRNQHFFSKHYCDMWAQLQTDKRKAIGHHLRRYNTLELRHYVLAKLASGWSPELIAGRLKYDFPRRQQMRISAEAIYQWVYKDLHRVAPCTNT